MAARTNHSPIAPAMLLGTLAAAIVSTAAILAVSGTWTAGSLLTWAQLQGALTFITVSIAGLLYALIHAKTREIASLRRRLEAVETNADNALPARMNHRRIEDEGLSLVQEPAAEATPDPANTVNVGEVLSGLRTDVNEVGRTERQLEDRFKVAGEGWDAEISSLNIKVDRLQKITIESQFDEWTDARLASYIGPSVAQTLHEFRGVPERVKLIADTQEMLKRLLEKATPWAKAVETWTAEFGAAPEVRANPSLAETYKGFERYTLELRRVIQDSEQLRRGIHPDAVPADVGSDISFFDVVSGRSAELLRDGYRKRLEQHMQQVETQSQDLAARWDNLRSQLFALIDAFYVNGESRTLAGNLNRALALANIYEIEVKPEVTHFSVTDHEPMLTVARADLPDNTVVHLEQRGFLFEGKVLRRARVTLSSKTAR